MLSTDILYDTLLRLEIEFDGIVLILILPHYKDRLATNLSIRGVGIGTCGIDRATIHIDAHTLTLQVHVLVIHLGLSVQVGHLLGGIVYQGVGCGIFNGRFYAILFLLVDTVQTDGVVDGLVVSVDSQLQGVHLRGVGLVRYRFF